ncbi:MAG: hypothetical protein Q8P05_04200 [Candidatus Diapherotrites archaeon]|nr:hypothetical protein [Candidatus Diapherotrites archaeon]MDZ4256623.1 hypothetical protein [archaeon]
MNAPSLLRGGLFGVPLLGLSPVVHAHCPLCTLAVGTGAVTASYLGMGLGAVGAFVGGAGMVMGLMFAQAMKKKYVPHQDALVIGGTFLLTAIAVNALPSDQILLPLRLLGESGGLLNKVYWIEKSYLGVAIGGVAALVAHGLHGRIRKTRGKSLIPYQGVLLSLLLVGSAAALLQWGVA